MQDPLKMFSEKDSVLYDSICNNRQMAFKEGAISSKNKLLIAMALDAVEGSASGVRALATMAMESGATKEEITETLRITYFICGVGTIYTAAQALDGLM